jgi:hypothetical protein
LEEMSAMMGGNPAQLAKQMQQMQARLAKIQEELGSETVEASVVGGSEGECEEEGDNQGNEAGRANHNRSCECGG